LLTTRRVTGGPSGKTSYVIVGENAGKSKIDKIKAIPLETLDEDGFLNLIATRKGAKPDEKQIKAMQKEEQKIRDAAKAMELKEKEDEKLRKRKEAALENTGMAAK
jgi:replication factor C subunit 1